MNRFILILSSLMHYWRSHLAVFLGVVAGTTVITGALIVGESVKQSLRQMSLDRLGKVDFALHAPRFLTQNTVNALNEQLSKDKTTSSPFDLAAPALLMDGSITLSEDDGTVVERAGKINVVGINESFAGLSEFTRETIPIDDEIVLSHQVAEQLRVKPGDKLTLWVELPSNIPRDTLFGDRNKEVSTEVLLTVKTILEETSPVGRFALNPSQQLPMTVFVGLANLQESIGLDEQLPERNPGRRRRAAPAPKQSDQEQKPKPARVNAIFVKAKTDDDRLTEEAVKNAEQLTELLQSLLTLEDLDLRIAANDALGYLSLESEQLILEDGFSAKAVEAASSLGWKTSRAMVYLANEFTNQNKPGTLSMYSIIAAVDFDEVSQPPFGPLLPEGTPAPKDFEIVANEFWKTNLQLEKSDRMLVKYHQVGSHGELPDEETVFTVHSTVPIDGNVTASDKGLTPAVRGVTDAKDFRSWKQPFPMDINRIPKPDDDYWEQHGPLPKGFINLSTAKQLWKNRYGSLTSVRVAPDASDEQTVDLAAASKKFFTAFRIALDVKDTGLIFQPIKFNGVRAASGTTDFSGLFFGFSFFVIISAMILIGLLFRLGIEKRSKSIGLLQAVGFNSKQVRRLYLTEGLMVAGDGAFFGSISGIGYAHLMIAALKNPDWWGGAIGTKFLFVHVSATSLVAGFAIALFVAWLALFLALRGLHAISPRQLLAGATEREQSDEDFRLTGQRHRKRAVIATLLCVLLTVLGLAGVIPASEAGFGLSWQVISFFVVGMTLLAAALWFLSASLVGDRKLAVDGKGMSGVARLGFRNASRHKQRSILSTGLIASATFVIVAVASGRRDPSVETVDFNSGNGGYVLVGESATPILDDLNTENGRDTAALSANATEQQLELLAQTIVTSYRVKPGENASCLNLYQSTLPTVLGVPDLQIERGGFKFINGDASKYWPLLKESREDGHIPVLGDMNTLMFSLHKGPGDTIDVPNSDQKLVVVGMLDSSVFQGVLLMSDDNFQELFPDASAYRYFLIGASDALRKAGNEFSTKQVNELARLFESNLTQYGLDVERVADRIARFLVVQNTYLSTFQTLGGLGLLLGTLGLATVMLRNVVERQSELALLRAVGFEKRGLAWMVLSENALLLVWGLVSGSVCALLAMLPHLLSTGADTPWLDGVKLLLVVFVVGMLAAVLAVKEASRTPIVASLRGD